MKNYLLFAIVLFSSKFVLGDECKSQTKPNPERHLFDQDFALAFNPDDLLTNIMSPFSSPFMFRDYIRPWRHLAAVTRDVGSTIKTDKDKFQINLDVQHFSPEEISIKTADGYVVIEAKHEEKQDEHGFISRQFVRRYSLPEGVESDAVISQLSSDGVLSISAPRKAVKGAEREVPITQTGPVRMEAKVSEEAKKTEL